MKDKNEQESTESTESTDSHSPEIIGDVAEAEIVDSIEFEDTGESEDWSQEDFEDADADEFFQIEGFLTQTLLVRCERYNANLTGGGCQRKKEALPPRVKNSSMTDEESIQNHPCFGCVGPIIINWDIDEPPVRLLEIKQAPVIVHPNSQTHLYSKDREEEEKKKVRIPSAGIAGMFTSSTSLEPEEVIRARERAKTSASTSTPISAQKEESVTKSPAQSPLLEVKPKENQAVTSKSEADVKPKAEAKPKVKAKLKVETKPNVKLKVEEAKEDTTTSDENEKEDGAAKKAKSVKPKSAAKKSEEKLGEHPPCENCSKPYASKYWRGKICNACYAKRLRERKKAKAPSPKKPKKKVGKQEPCAICSKPYAPRHWRGDICNACYAKRLRERKKAKEQKEKDA